MMRVYFKTFLLLLVLLLGACSGLTEQQRQAIDSFSESLDEDIKPGDSYRYQYHALNVSDSVESFNSLANITLPLYAGAEKSKAINNMQRLAIDELIYDVSLMKSELAVADEIDAMIKPLITYNQMIHKLATEDYDSDLQEQVKAFSNTLYSSAVIIPDKFDEIKGQLNGDSDVAAKTNQEALEKSQQRMQESIAKGSSGLYFLGKQYIEHQRATAIRDTVAAVESEAVIAAIVDDVVAILDMQLDESWLSLQRIRNSVDTQRLACKVSEEERKANVVNTVEDVTSEDVFPISDMCLAFVPVADDENDSEGDAEAVAPEEDEDSAASDEDELVESSLNIEYRVEREIRAYRERLKAQLVSGNAENGGTDSAQVYLTDTLYASELEMFESQTLAIFDTQLESIKKMKKALLDYKEAHGKLNASLQKEKGFDEFIAAAKELKASVKEMKALRESIAGQLSQLEIEGDN